MEEYLIGRAENCQIVIKDNHISREHAKIIVLNGKYTLKDLNSTSGTYVNDIPVQTKNISQSDCIKFGNYTLSFSFLMDKIEELRSINKTDFTREFLELKLYYEDFKKKKIAIEKKYGKKDIWKRIAIASAINLIIFFIFTYESEPNTSKIKQYLTPALAISSLLSGILIFNPAKNEDKREEFEILIEGFKEIYHCPNPKCKTSFGTKSWEALRISKKCPNQNCKARWEV
jgi:hypothetical protein